MIDRSAGKHRLETFEKLCRERSLPFTIQRRAILEALLDREDHPTADQIHEAVARHIPEIARTTVYRTLETLVQIGLITKACHPGRGVRYDRQTDVHHHLVCLHCDRVIDISDERLDALQVPDTSVEDFKVVDFSVQLRGICRSCRNEEEQP